MLQTTQTKWFLKLLKQTLNKLLRPDCEQIVPGDFNISFKSNSSRICKSYNKNLLDMFNLMQLIKDHTPVPPTSSTIIDHIIYSNHGPGWLNELGSWII